MTNTNQDNSMIVGKVLSELLEIIQEIEKELEEQERKKG